MEIVSLMRAVDIALIVGIGLFIFGSLLFSIFSLSVRPIIFACSIPLRYLFMAKDAKYIPFPLYHFSGLPGNLDEIFDYGILKFARMAEYADLSTVYRQVLYDYYRGNLPASLLRKLVSWLKKKLLILTRIITILPVMGRNLTRKRIWMNLRRRVNRMSISGRLVSNTGRCSKRWRY